MNFLFHAFTERPIHDLVLLHPILFAKFGTDNDCFEMLTIADDFDVLAVKAFLDIGFDSFRT